MDRIVAIIQAGGKGTRMDVLTKGIIPKPMLKLNAKPMIQWQIEDLKNAGITEIIIITGHLGEKIREYFADGSNWGVHIQYIEEHEPLGSAGALYYAREIVRSESFIFIFGDVMLQLDWERFMNYHLCNKGMATILVHPNAHPYDSDLVVLDGKKRVVVFDSKNNIRDYWYANCVNAGVYVFQRDILNLIDQPQMMDLEKDILVPLMTRGMVYGYHTSEYVKDVGTPERLSRAKVEQAAGMWSAKSLKNKQKCIFLDRDGTVNKYVGLLYKAEQLELEDTVVEAIKEINESEYLAILVTNQPVVARGMCDISEISNIHKKLQTILGQNGAYLDDIFFCPHHPDKGYPDENPLYKKICHCRKPDIGMLELAVEKYNIDLSRSYIIGDSTVDIKMGKNVYMHTVLVETGQNGKDGKFDVTADYVAKNLLDAVKWCLEKLEKKAM